MLIYPVYQNKNHILKNSGPIASHLYSPKCSYVAWGCMGLKNPAISLFLCQGKTLQDDARSSGERYLLPHLWCFGYRSGGIFFFLRVGWKELEVGSSCVVFFFVEAQLLPVAYWQANMMNGCVAGVASTRVILIS